MKTDREVIEGAISLIEGDGKWCQGQWCRPSQTDDSMAFCLEGAIRHSAAGQGVKGLFYLDNLSRLRELTTREVINQIHRLEDAVAVHTYGRDGVPWWGPLSNWNDWDRTTQEDAILVLKKTLEDLD